MTNRDMKPILACLARLRYCVRAERTMTPEDMAAQDRIYARSLADFDPMVINSASEEWSRTKQFWPELSELMALCREHEKLAEISRRPRLSPPEPQTSRREPLRDSQILTQWAERDRMGSDIAAHPERYIAADVLLRVWAGFRAKREAEHPDLAARYYATQAQAAE